MMIDMLMQSGPRTRCRRGPMRPMNRKDDAGRVQERPRTTFGVVPWPEDHEHVGQADQGRPRRSRSDRGSARR